MGLPWPRNAAGIARGSIAQHTTFARLTAVKPAGRAG